MRHRAVIVAGYDTTTRGGETAGASYLGLEDPCIHNPSEVTVKEKTKKTKPCGNAVCGVSTGIDGSLTFGSGHLDANGFWERPCNVCEKTHRERDADQRAWKIALAIEDELSDVLNAGVMARITALLLEQKPTRETLQRILTNNRESCEGLDIEAIAAEYSTS
jgi:hypothetical protein